MAGDVTIRFGAQVGELLTALDTISDKTAQSDQFFRRYRESVNSFDAQLSKLIDTLDPAAGDMQKLSSATTQLDAALKLGMVSAQQHADLMGRAHEYYGSAAEGADRYAGSTVGARREMMVLAHEAVSGNFSRIPGSMMVLAERTDGASGAFKALAGAILSPTGAVIGFGAAMAAMIVHAEHADRAMASLGTAFSAVGNSARFNRDEMERFVHQLSLMPGISKSSAEEIVTAFARTRQIGGQLFAQLTGIVADFAAATGKKAPEAARDLAKAFADPLSGARSLDSQLGILTAAQLRSIETFDRQDDKARAQAVLFDALNARVKNLAHDGQTELQQSASRVEIAWDRMVRAIGNTSWVNKAKAGVEDFSNFVTRVLDPSAQDKYDRALENYSHGLSILRAAEADYGKNPSSWNKTRIEDATWALEKYKRTLDETFNKVESQTFDVAAPKADPAVDKNSSEEIKKRADALRQFMPLQEKSREIDGQIADLRKAAAESTGEERKHYEGRIAEAEKQKANLTQKTGGGETALQAMQAELDKRHMAETRSAADWLEIDRNFWQQKLANAQSGTAEYDQIQRRLVTAQNALTREQLATDKALRREGLATDAELGRIRLQTERDRLEAEVTAGRMTAVQKVDALRILADEEYRLGLARLDEEIKLLDKGTIEFKKALDQRAILQAKHGADQAASARQREAAEKDAAVKTTQAWETAFQPITSAMHTMLQGVLMGTQTMGQAMKRAAGNMLLSFGESLAGMMLKFAVFKISQLMGWTQIELGMKTQIQGGTLAWLLGEQAKTTATTTGNAARTAAVVGAEAAQTGAVVSNEATRSAAQTAGAVTEKAAATSSIMVKAGDAAASVYDEVAQIPYVGWILAPAAAAAAYVAVAGYSSFSAEGGWERVPYDGAITELHKDEMVLPARIANPLRNLADGGIPSYAGLSAPRGSPVNLGATSSGASGASGSASPVNVTFQVHAIDQAGVKTFFKQHGPLIAQTVAGQARDFNKAAQARRV